MSDLLNGRHYCRTDTPDANGLRSECGSPNVQCESCRNKNVITSLEKSLQQSEQHVFDLKLSLEWNTGVAVTLLDNMINAAEDNFTKSTFEEYKTKLQSNMEKVL